MLRKTDPAPKPHVDETWLYKTYTLMIGYQDTKTEDQVVEYQELLTRRAAVADEIVKTIDTLGELVAEERELQDRLRRLGEAAGVKATPFSTAVTVTDAINSELTRAGLSPRRADPRMRLTALVVDQNRRYRSQREVRQQVVDQSAA
jgi:hypothetical protein